MMVVITVVVGEVVVGSAGLELMVVVVLVRMVVVVDGIERSGNASFIQFLSG